METRMNWGIVVFALASAVLGIALTFRISVGMPARQNVPVPGALTATQALAASADTGNEEWRKALDSVVTVAHAASTGEYRAPKELGTTPAVSQELVATYFKLKSENKLGTAAADQELQKLVDRNVKVVTPSDPYTLSSVKTDGSVTLDAYAQSVGTSMQRSATVKEYELTTFARTVGVQNYHGTSELGAAAQVYRTIEHELIAAPVPTGLSGEHLAVVKSIAYLAQSDELMAGWTGDPLDALSYIDAFVQAERQTRVAFDALFAAMVKIGKQS